MEHRSRITDYRSVDVMQTPLAITIDNTPPTVAVDPMWFASLSAGLTFTLSCESATDFVLSDVS